MCNIEFQTLFHYTFCQIQLKLHMLAENMLKLSAMKFHAATEA